MIESPANEQEQDPDQASLPPVGHTSRRGEKFLTTLLTLPLIAIIAAVMLSTWWTTVQPIGFFRAIKESYFCLTIILPAILLLCGLPGYLLTRRDNRCWPRRLALAWVAGGMLLIGLRVYATHIEPHRLQVRHFTINTDKVSTPLRVLHVSDIQSDRVGRYDERAFAMMRQLHPDLVIHTGDMLHPIRPATFDSEWPKLAALWNTLQPPLGKLNISGTVDQPLAAVFRRGEGGLRTLENESVTITAPGVRLQILGLSNDYSANNPAVGELTRQWLARSAPRDLTMLIGHQPDFIYSVQDLPIDLCLAGHTHGGQICLPFIGPISTMSAIPCDRASGFQTWGRTKLIISAGVGCEHIEELPDLRFNCPPEMTMIEFIPAQ